MLYTMKSLRFQSISTQHADLIALKFWYDFGLKSLPRPFVSLSIHHPTTLKLFKVKLITSFYTTIGHRLRSFLKFYSFFLFKKIFDFIKVIHDRTNPSQSVYFVLTD